MRLLLDQTLPLRAAAALSDEFPGTAHVAGMGLDRAGDVQVWLFARERGLVIVSLDDDFYQRATLLGHPPKGVWLRLADRSTAGAIGALRGAAGEMRSFDADPDQSLMIVTRERPRR